MKALLRSTGLAAALALTVLTTTAVAFPPGGTCTTYCYNPLTHTLGHVSWTATSEAQCCGGSVNPCPSGTTPNGGFYQPFGGSARICPAV
jgi:hypothetical protein